MINNFVTLNHHNGEIRIKAEPTIARELACILSTLLDFSRTLHAKIHHARAINNVTEKDLKRRRKAFEDQSRQVFAKFCEHLNNGCNGDKAAAIQCIKKDFSLGYGEAKIFITKGRRLFREQRKKRPSAQRAPRSA